jgi:hypothetical protein
MIKHARKALLGAAAAVVIALATAAPAQATDNGGDGNAQTDCSNGYTVAAATIYGSRGSTAGQPIGQVQLRWSYACGGNWSRVVLYGGLYSTPVNIQQEVDAEGRSAISDDTVSVPSGGTTAWTRYLRLANTQSTACAYVWLSGDFGTMNYHTNGAHVCA